MLAILAVCNLFLISCYSARWQLSQYQKFCFPKTSFCVSQLIFFSGERILSLACIYEKHLWKVQTYRDVIDVILLCVFARHAVHFDFFSEDISLYVINFFLSIINFYPLTLVCSSLSTFLSHFFSSSSATVKRWFRSLAVSWVFLHGFWLFFNLAFTFLFF